MFHFRNFKIMLSGESVWIPAFAGMTLLVAACAAGTPPPATSSLTPLTYAELPGWNADHPGEAVPALIKSCGIILQKSPEASLGTAGRDGDWRPACIALGRIPPGDDAAARAFFENYFQPFAVSGPEGDTGLFTGYYEAGLHGSWKRGGKYQTPIYARPRDLVTADLGEFSGELKGRHITGKADHGRFIPYDDRAAIDGKNSLRHRAKVLMWVDDPVDAFFLAVQGSGRVEMKNGKAVRVGYDIQNGHSYVAIGRVLAEMNAIEKPVTMQKIREWLAAHPDRAQAVMDENPSYVFFRILKGDGPIGAEGVALTPGRSLAVDRSFISLGTPVWLDTQDGMGAPLQRLMVAQDTGGAIKGALRGDFFWGFGPEAETQAGAMQSKGRYFVLLPAK